MGRGGVNKIKRWGVQSVFLTIEDTGAWRKSTPIPLPV